MRPKNPGKEKRKKEKKKKRKKKVRHCQPKNP